MLKTSALRSFGAGFLLLLLVTFASGCSGERGVLSGGPFRPILTENQVLSSLPPLDREFRAVWIATVANIDWPSAPALPSFRQQDELLRILDRAVHLGMNAVVLQVRPTADAFYKPGREPWSYYLTGQSGQRPNPFWDPLAFAIEEAHKRGLELHAWFNPFRAGHPTANDSLSSGHISRIMPESVVQYGDYQWLDPGDEAATAHSLSVIVDVVSRYDLDGVHMDDYFYPYPIQDSTGAHIPFPDTTSWRMVGASSGLGRSDWRRRNVNRFIERLYRGIKATKPWVVFGVSPFGIWRPDHPAGIVGFDAYEQIHADSRLWLREGWVDYLSPQLYWAVDSPGQPYGALLDWWIDQNEHGRHIWPGLYTSRVILEGSAYWGPDEIVRQVRQTRIRTGADGNIHFSMRAMMPALHAMGETVATKVYAEPAFRPTTTWLGGRVPDQPTLSVNRIGRKDFVTIRASSPEEVRVWAVRVLERGRWHTLSIPGWRRIVPLGEFARVDAVVVQAIDRLGLTSEPAVAIPVR